MSKTAEILLDANATEKYAIYAMMASNAYLKPDRTYFPLENLGWLRVDESGKPTKINSYTPKMLGKVFSSLQFDIWENQNNRESVISFKGSDERVDWIVSNFAVGMSVSYKSAKKHVMEYMKKHPERNVTVTGHSLGGGLALSSSLWLGVDAYVFNSSPRVFDGIKNHHKDAQRIAIYQNGDLLQRIRKHWPKFKEAVKSEDVIQTSFDFMGISNHRADLLAEGLLRCAYTAPNLVAMANKLEVKVVCPPQK